MQHYNHIKMKTPPYALLKRLSSVGKDLTQFTQVAYERRHNYILLSFICFLFISFFSLSFVSYFYCVSYVHKNDTKFNKKNKGGKHGVFLCLPLSHEYCYPSKVIYSFNCPRIFTSLSISTVSLCQTVMVNKYETKKIF